MQFHLIFRRSITYSLLILLSYSVWAKTPKIRVKIIGLADTSIILAHYLNKSIYPDDTTELNSKGEGEFELKKPLHEGMYIIYFPSGSYFEFIVGKDQDFSITTDTTDFIANAIIEGSEENILFFDFQKYMLSRRDEIKGITDILKNSDNEANKKAARKRLDELNKEREDKINAIVTQHPDLFVATFLKSTMDIKVPEPPKDTSGKIDSLWQYLYYKKHYFDNFDPSDGRLLFTPLYEEKIKYYLDKVLPQIPDTLIKEIDTLLVRAKSDSTLFRYLLITLFNTYGNSNIMGFDAIQVHLAEEYYLKYAWWSDEKFLKELKERVEILDPLLLGKVAPDVELLLVPSDHFKAAANDTALKKYPHVGKLVKLHEIPADYLVLLFWEATCSHCKKAVPEMYSIYKEQLESMGVKVLAISTLFGEDGKEKWIDFVNNHELYDWINAWNPYDYQYKVVYDIRSTPQIYVLDKDKKIIGKRIGPEQVPELIKAYKKVNP